MASNVTKSKLVIISTKLPVTVKKVNGKLIYSSSTGGLATGMTSVAKSTDSIWIGWPYIASDELTSAERKEITTELKKYNCHPVFLSSSEVDDYYSGYCNATIWPLFHYFTDMAEYVDKYWESYKYVNELYSKEAKQFIDDDTQVWIHDYQLMLLPEMLRAKHKHASIGFFLHTPFPSFEIFRLLPNREALLNGLLGANLIGFHTYDYVRHFLSSTLRLLGHESSLGAIKIEDRLVQTDAFPIGIDYKKFSKSTKKRNVKKLLKSFNLFKENTKVILAVDRADYSKGIPARLDAFEMFLTQNPEYLGKVALVLLAVPSRGDVEAYQDLRSQIEQKVSRINGHFSTVDWVPITYRYQSLPFDELSALYALADVMLVTPLRDGMNLVAKEYVASHHKSDGVLILSEMAGVATELPEAVMVNPTDSQRVADSIKLSLEMPTKEQKQRMRRMQSRISEYTIEKWANDFMSELSKIGSYSSNKPKMLTQETMDMMMKDYREAQTRLILLDYDGTLKSFVSSPDDEMARPTARVKKLLNQLTKDKKNKVIIVSGRPKNTMTKFFDDKGLGLIAEHGGWIFEAGAWVKSSVTSKKWKKEIKPILEQYASRTPGAEVEEKDFSLVWHYRRVSPDMAYVRKEELKIELQNVVDHENVGVFEGQKIIEVKPKRMHKGALVTEILDREETPDFIMAIGDDYTDEDMFEVLPERAYSINVGSRETVARFQLDDVQAVLKLLEKLK